jgi:hypothetical protein
MISWAIRGLLIVSGFLISWFVGIGCPNLLVFIVAVVAFWPERWSHLLNRLHK